MQYALSVALVGLSLISLAACTSSSEVPDAADEAMLGRVCRATISAIMGRDSSTIEAVGFLNDYVETRYVRPEDDKVWFNRCKLNGNQVIWRTVDAAGPGTGLGRWRDSVEDEFISFEVVDDRKIKINQKFADGSQLTDLIEVN